MVILLMALWLPFQALVAVAMPFCQDMPSPADAAPSHQHHGEHHGAGAAGSPEFPLECNDCGPCHLACAPMVGMAANIIVLPVSQTLHALPQALPPARMLDQPHPPPLA